MKPLVAINKVIIILEEAIATEAIFPKRLKFLKVFTVVNIPTKLKIGYTIVKQKNSIVLKFRAPILSAS